VSLSFSIILPSYQQKAFLGAALASLQEQHFDRLELLIQDGGSTDGSLELIQQFLSTCPFTAHLSSGKDGGQAAAINQGLRQARGDILSFLNSDDVLYPGTLTKVATLFAQDPDLDMVYGRGDYLDAEGRFLTPYPVKPWSREVLLEECFICQPACFWRARLLDKIGVFDETLLGAFDYDYWLRAASVAKVTFLDEVLAGSRCHPEAKTFRFRRQLIEECCQVQAKHCGGHVSLPNLRERASVLAGSHLTHPLPTWLSQLVYYTRYLFYMLWSLPQTKDFFHRAYWQGFFPSYTIALKKAQNPLSRIPLS
jgi:glycosyltransferase involved in cell wall biosynthesis